MRLALLVLLVLSPVDRASAQRELGEGFVLHDRLPISALQAVACSREHAYVRGWSGDVVRWNGAADPTELPELAHPAYGREIWVSPGGRVLVTASARVAAWDGTTWTDHPLPSVDGGLGALWGLGARTFFLAARGSVIASIDGAPPRAFDTGTWRDLTAIWGDDAGTLFVGGQGGTIMRRRGARFEREPTGTDAWIRGLFGTSESDVFAWAEGAGRERVVLHYDGRAWTRAEEGLPAGEVDAIGGAPGAVYAVGAFGIARWDAGRWTLSLPIDAITDVHGLNGVCATSRSLVVSARGGFLITRPLRD